MIPLDIAIIVMGAVVLIMAIITPLISIFFRKVTDKHDDDSNQDLPKLTVLLTVHDHARELESHLPPLLNQDYPAGYEVVVVVSKGEDNTDDILKQFSVKYPNLYVTFIPDTSRYMSRKKLAVTLGVKAARNEWIIMTEAACVPASDQWLKKMAQSIDDQTDMVIGYTNYDNEATDYQRFERLLFQRYILRKAQQKTAYRSDSGNLMFRKSLFLNGRGFEGNLKYIRGEYDFIVNKFAEKGRTHTVTDSDTWMIEDMPNKKRWVNRHLFYMETRRHLRRSFTYRLPFCIDQLAMHLNYLLILAAALYGAYLMRGQSSNSGAWILSGCAAFALLITFILRIVIARKGCQQFGETIPVWKIIPFEFSIVWHNLWFWIRHKLADRYNFICHKV